MKDGEPAQWRKFVMFLAAQHRVKESNGYKHKQTKNEEIVQQVLQRGNELTGKHTNRPRANKP